MTGLSPKVRRYGPQPDDLSKLSMPFDEVILRLRRRAGVHSKVRPKSGTEKSTTIRLIDIALLARLDREDLYKFSIKKRRYGLKVIERLIDVLRQIDAGLITKSQYGVYHFHDEPVVKPVREMRVSLGAGKIMQGVKVATYQKMPSFSKLFGSK